MPQSLSQVLVHLVFSTKNRTPHLHSSVQAELHAYIVGILKGVDCYSLRTGGVEDHVHLLFGLARTRTMAEVVEAVKTSSSKWLKTKGSSFADFHWQSGYAAFSVSESQVNAVVAYIENQVIHHKTVTFQEEYMQLLKKHQIAYDDRYMWD